MILARDWRQEVPSPQSIFLEVTIAQKALIEKGMFCLISLCSLNIMSLLKKFWESRQTLSEKPLISRSTSLIK